MMRETTSAALARPDTTALSEPTPPVLAPLGPLHTDPGLVTTEARASAALVDSPMLDAQPSTIKECYQASATTRPPCGLFQCAEPETIEAFFTTLAAYCKAGAIKPNFALQFPSGLHLCMSLSPGLPTVTAPPTATPVDPARATTWAGRVGPPTSVRPPRVFAAPDSPTSPSAPTILPFATVRVKGQHLNLLNNIASTGANRKTHDVRPYGHRLGGGDGLLLRNATTGTVLSGVTSRVCLDLVITGDIVTYESVGALQAAIIRGDLGPDACALPDSLLGPDDAYMILKNGRKVFTPEAAQAFYDRNYPSTSGRRTDGRVLVAPCRARSPAFAFARAALSWRHSAPPAPPSSSPPT
jgi:hypothetical protein